MKFFSTAVLIATLSTVTLSLPQGELVDRAATVTCKNSKGDFKITSSQAENNMHAAPVSAGKSGYPHEFTNQQKITWPNTKCAGAKLLEFPVFADGHLYNASSKPKDDPGAARVIYTTPSKDFCGVIAHLNGNEGNFALCT